jgi:hypothetical protein
MASTLGVTGLLTASGGLKISGGTVSAGRIAKDASSGVAIMGQTGSVSDLDLISPSGLVLFRNPTGTNNTQVGSSLGTTTIYGTVSVPGNLSADTLISPKFYAEGQFTGTLTGCATSPTAIFYYIRIGKQVTIKIPEISATSNANTMTITGLPADITPAADIMLTQGRVANCQDNGTYYSTCLIVVTSTGALKFAAPAAGYTGFTTSGTKGTAGLFTPVLQTFTYVLL